MRFRLTCKSSDRTDGVVLFYYDNETGLLHDSGGVSVGQPRSDLSSYEPAFKTDPIAAPIRKSQSPKVLKVQMGLSCNYSCSYCLQKHVSGSDETASGQVTQLIEKIERNLAAAPDRIQLWGGEPLVYLKTLRPLVAGLKRIFPRSKLSIITNGSLLTKEINDWLISNEIGASISHDGPGQRHRGPDPFDDPRKAEAILDLYWRKKAAGDPVTIGAMIYLENPDRAAVASWLCDKFCDPDLIIAEGAIIEVYDQAAKGRSPNSYDDHLLLRQTSLANIRDRKDRNFYVSKARMGEWLDTMKHGRMLDGLGMKCGMDRDDTLTIDMKGNVITCQNSSASANAPNGQPHNGGHVDKLSEVSIRSSVHFLNRSHCQGCPVVQVCKGGCMYLVGDLFSASCNNTFTDHIPYFAAAVEALTGYLPVLIEDEADKLPEARKLPFGKKALEGLSNDAPKSWTGAQQKHVVSTE